MDPMTGSKANQLGNKAFKLTQEVVEQNEVDQCGLDNLSPHVSHAQANKAGAIRNYCTCEPAGVSMLCFGEIHDLQSVESL